MPTDSESAVVPRPLKLAAGVVAAEGVVVAALGIAEAFTIDSSRLVLGLTTTVFLLAYGGGLLVVARGLTRASTWSRGPTVFSQLMQLLIAWSFWGGSTKWVTIVLAVAALAVLVAVYQKASMDALRDDPTKDHPVL
ncbi:hypothetical protein EV643_102115 [Kribbella sp. VKM Ac-2527]|uniref:Integral membrane protein n=1 Tax=Kribbella caucasensis TaxID=2512215 RepID=A0A4R6KL78_9ACTN|nr:hypothetical protein [Kribbella sp. VKM Ac-2527]TDO52278.1 hypothetical protein EV643_102115 [Kribbella sp. VKM Ac-2527]